MGAYNTQDTLMFCTNTMTENIYLNEIYRPGNKLPILVNEKCQFSGENSTFTFFVYFWIVSINKTHVYMFLYTIIYICNRFFALKCCSPRRWKVHSKYFNQVSFNITPNTHQPEE